MLAPFDTRPYFASFQLLVRDLHRLLEYVEPTDKNEKTFSHRIHELLFRVCAEVESLCRDTFIGYEWNKKNIPRRKLNMADYRKLKRAFALDRFHVGLLFWKPDHRIVKPFAAWSKKQPLTWYDAYNAVKHDRNKQFAQANLLNLTDAFAGLFMLLARVDGDRFHMGSSHHVTHDHYATEEFYLDCDRKDPLP